jgi:hypothetical protein
MQPRFDTMLYATVATLFPGRSSRLLRAKVFEYV